MRATPISVVLHVWNGERYLDEALDSILSQTHHRFELCVLDDGSDDSTPRILERTAAGDHRVRLARQDPLGRDRLHETFNRVLAMARHELVAIANADDVWLPQKLARQVRAFEADPELDVCWHDAVVIDERGDWLRPTLHPAPMLAAQPGMSPRRFITGNPVPNPTVMFRRSIVDRIGPQETGWTHDSQFWFRAALHRCRFLGLAERLIRYRVHEESHSNSTARRDRLLRENRAMLAAQLDRTSIDDLYPELAEADDPPSRAWAHGHLGVLAWRAGLHRQARDSWRTSISIHPNEAVRAWLNVPDGSGPLWSGTVPPIARLVIEADTSNRR